MFLGFSEFDSESLKDAILFLLIHSQFAIIGINKKKTVLASSDVF